MTLVFMVSCYAAVVAGSYYFAAKTARPIPFPNWVWEEEEGRERRDQRKAA